MDADSPRLSVVTTVYNGERYLAEAIESILGQTFRDFEYLLVDDASTDTSPEILDYYARQDRRIRVLRNASNSNVSRSLNRAMETATGVYFANLDQDDIAYPHRLERQVAFLDSHPHVAVVGAQAMSIDETGAERHAMKSPQAPEMARWHILFGTPILHSTAMMRRALALAAGGYSVSQWYVNDYILFARLMRSHQLANLSETLVAYRRHSGQTASVFSKPQRGQAWLLIHSMLAERLGLRVPLDDIGMLFDGVRGLRLEHSASIMRVTDLLQAIYTRYLDVEQPASTIAAQIEMDCAWRLLTIAWVHRHSNRTESRIAFRRALAYDPKLMHHPGTRVRLRRLADKEHRQATAPR